MPKPFVALTIDEFREALARFPFRRRVNAVHMHHTFRPNRSQYRGLASIEAMHDFHTRERGFNDIAQHITIAPDGTIWTGRNWDAPPASATGHNGNTHAGPFMFEMIGDFDTGQDAFEDPQRRTVIEVIAAVNARFALPAESLRFHRQMAPKTCPGSAIDQDDIIAAVKSLQGPSGSVSGGARSAGDQPFLPSHREDHLAGAGLAAVTRALDALGASTGTRGEASDAAELPESDEEVRFTSNGGITSAAARGVVVTATDLVALRPHVINLNEGQLTGGGEYSTLPEDVERIFREDIVRAFDDPASIGMPPRAPHEPFRVMIWAHGGLIGEQDGLAIATKHLQFWKKNGIYPIYFVWETGLMQTIGQLIRSAGAPAGARNVFSDNISDPLIERAVRLLGGEKIWSGMKRNAELASAQTGGATKAAAELKGFLDHHGGTVQVHASGHSAGAIFHAQFLPVAFAAGISNITSLHLLAPAIRVDTFRATLLPAMGATIAHTTMYTMLREQELDDHCAQLYRKSLLYLIRFSLEKDHKAEILGLEESLRRDTSTARAFGLAGASSTIGEVVFSPSVASDGQDASASISHGGFDDDPATMNAMALRVLGRSSKSDLAQPYPPTGARTVALDPWAEPAEVGDIRRSFASAVAVGGNVPLVSTQLTPVGANNAPVLSAAIKAPAASTSPGQRRHALCVGIDRYQSRPLAGCVADALLWQRTLQGLGFSTDTLLDEQATYDNIVAALERLVRSAGPGDVIVWQYAGHGTKVPDVNGDEAQGDSPGQDEAICPVDMHTGRLFVDDDIGALIQQLQPGVAFTMLMDCCHSGTLNRLGLGDPNRGAPGLGERPRFIPLSEDVKQKYLAFAQSGTRQLRADTSRTRSQTATTSEVLFTACLSTEVAWESNGQGEFTVRATRLLSQRGDSLSNEEFHAAVLDAFGTGRRQSPTLECAQALRTRRLFAPFTSGGMTNSAPADRGGASLGPERLARAADALEVAARALRGM